MTRKHLRALAEAIAKIDDPIARAEAANLIADVCARFNDEFDCWRFLVACRVVKDVPSRKA